MSDDYLWDRSGKPDPEVERLERVLGTLRHVDRGEGGAEGGAAPGPPAAPIPITSARRTARVLRTVLLLAAGLAALCAALLWLAGRPRPDQRVLLANRLGLAVDAGQLARAMGAKWRVERLAGIPTCGTERVETEGALGVGQWLETDHASRAKLEVAEIGVIEVAAQSRLRLAASGPNLHRIDLQRGTISARVNAPPRLFVVGTPAAAAVDLGCVYTLAVDDAGAATLSVSHGWVSLEDRGRASLVPAGATCLTRPGSGPGTPWFDDAPPALRDALRRFDFEGGGAPSVKIVLKEARKRDSLTLWHLLSRVDEGLRRAVYERLHALAPPPEGIGEPDVMRLDRPALDQWKNDLVVTW